MATTLMVRDVALAADDAARLATAEQDKLLASMLETPERAGNALAWLRDMVMTNDTPRVRDVQALSLIAECEDAILAWATSDTTSEVNRAKDVLNGLLAYLARKLPATAYNEAAKSRTKNDVNTAMLKSLRGAAGRAVRRDVSYTAPEYVEMLADAQKREAAAEAKRKAAAQEAQKRLAAVNAIAPEASEPEAE